MEVLECFVYPVCLVAGLLGGLVTKRLPLAALIGFVVAPALDAAMAQAFSDAEPRFRPVDSLMFGVVGAILAVGVWAIKRAVQRSRRQPS